MFYRKNLPAGERWARMALGLVIAGAGVALAGWTPAGWLALAAGLGAAATGLVGFCPACALLGRRPVDKATPSGPRP